jgi:hypothetical protein
MTDGGSKIKKWSFCALLVRAMRLNQCAKLGRSYPGYLPKKFRTYATIGIQYMSDLTTSGAHRAFTVDAIASVDLFLVPSQTECIERG